VLLAYSMFEGFEIRRDTSQLEASRSIVSMLASEALQTSENNHDKDGTEIYRKG